MKPEESKKYLKNCRRWIDGIRDRPDENGGS